MKTAMTLLIGLAVGAACMVGLQEVFREPVFVEYNPTVERLQEFLPSSKLEIVEIHFYGTDEMEVRERARVYLLQMAETTGLCVPNSKTRVILSQHLGGRTHWVYYKAT